MDVFTRDSYRYGAALEHTHMTMSCHANPQLFVSPLPHPSRLELPNGQISSLDRGAMTTKVVVVV